jgi:hypothetical protein
MKVKSEFSFFEIQGYSGIEDDIQFCEHLLIFIGCNFPNQEI